MIRMDQIYTRRNRKNGVMVVRLTARIKFVVLGFAALLACTYIVYHSEWFQKKYLYPYPHQPLVVKYAEARNLDPALVAGVIFSESKFNLRARSHKGATGLMQLMPDTANWIAEQLDDDQFTIDELQDPEINIRFGTWYLRSLEREFHGNEVLILAAYNAGRGNVKEWMKKYGWDMSFNDVRKIPFAETREYVARVLSSREKYRNLYRE